MKIKLAIVGRLNYYFCGNVALSLENTVETPYEVELGDLSNQEIIGLSRAIRTKVITAVSGGDELLEKAINLVTSSKFKKTVVIDDSVTKVPEVKVEEVKTEEVKELVSVEEETEKEPDEEPEKEITEVKSTPVTRAKRTSVKK